MLANEFAAVEVQLDNDANGPRLRITDLETGISVWLNPIVLRGLVLAVPERLTALVAEAVT